MPYIVCHFPHISISPCFCPLQSEYCKFHSTETALLKFTNGIMETIDSEKITILTTLDMSAAFDIVDHTTLLHRQQTFSSSQNHLSMLSLGLPLIRTNLSSFVKIDSSCTTICIVVQGGLRVLSSAHFSLFFHITYHQSYKYWPVKHLSLICWWYLAVYQYKLLPCLEILNEQAFTRKHKILFTQSCFQTELINDLCWICHFLESKIQFRFKVHNALAQPLLQICHFTIDLCRHMTNLRYFAFNVQWHKFIPWNKV